MPELPDLEIIRQVLVPWLTGQTITDVEIVRPLVVRDLTGQTFTGVRRRHKLLLFSLHSGLTLAVNCKLAGRLQYALPAERRLTKTHVVLHLSGGRQLRYSDRKTMGQVYLTASTKAIPGWAEMGPEPFDLTLAEFQERLKPYRGEIKGVLTRGKAVAGDLLRRPSAPLPQAHIAHRRGDRPAVRGNAVRAARGHRHTAGARRDRDPPRGTQLFVRARQGRQSLPGLRRRHL